MDAAEADGQAADSEDVRLAGQVGSLGARGDPLPAGRGDVGGLYLHLLVEPEVDVAGDAGQVLQQGEDEDDAAEKLEPVPAQAEPNASGIRAKLGEMQAVFGYCG
jgi:hypothetical protein